MMVFHAVALFCEDIREETAGTQTLVGIMPDNVQFDGNFPISLPRLGVYLRINLPVGSEVEPLDVILFTGSLEQKLTTMDDDFVRRAIDEAKSNGASFAGLISRVVAQNIRLTADTRIRVVVRTREADIEAGSLRVKTTPAT